MATVISERQVGPLLRQWRGRRRLSQLELALEAGVSARHLSFVETGRSKPGRDTLLRVLGRLDVPLREQNRLLLAAGHAPAFPERPLGGPELAPVREALDLILRGHEPYPAVVVDRAWNLVAANSSTVALASGVDVEPALLEPPVNVLRVGLHPRGFGSLVVNLAEWRAHFLERLERQIALTGDGGLTALAEEIASYPIPAADPGRDTLDPVRFRLADGAELSFFGMFATFDTPFDVTSSELAVELLFPADRTTATVLRKRTRQGR
jgi:transcriptional regulator with XRE-family HTH domain